MEYTNPEIPEGINAGKEHPLREFFWLTASVLALFAMALLVLGLLADRLAVYIPFSIEQRITADRIRLATDHHEITGYLNRLAVRIARAQDLPADMTLTVHYLDDETVNAFATLGGHIFMFRGLMEKLPNENALAMVLAHEIAHIRHRDPIRSAGRGVIIGTAVSMVSAGLGDAALDRLFAGGSGLTVLRYSRGQEGAADAVALASLVRLYGHAGGARELFEILEQANAGPHVPEFFSTHPHTSGRIERAQSLAAAGTVPAAAVPLPRDYRRWLKQTSVEPRVLPASG